MKRSLVYPKLPNAGLGNMLLVWASAATFSKLNSLPIIAPFWGRVRIGPLLRGEKEKRFYTRFFSNKGYISPVFGYLQTIGIRKVYNPPIEALLADSVNSNTSVYVFDAVPPWSDYFGEIRKYHALVKQSLLSNINPWILHKVSTSPDVSISIHVRLGDYRKLNPGEDFSKVGLVRTPIEWYCKVLLAIRRVVGYEVPAVIYSDGYDRELQDLLLLPKVSRANQGSAIEDLLCLSKSKLLIASAGSTFSGWASYLGRCPTIWHPAHFHTGVFSEDISSHIFEGGFEPDSMPMPHLLYKNLISTFL